MKKILIILAAMLAAAACYAGVNDSASIIFPLLDIGAGARALGMGEAFTAIADDASAVYWNAAGLGDMKAARVALTYDRWFADTFFDQALFACPLPAGAIGADLVYMNIPLPGRNGVNGELTQTISNYSFGGSVGYGINFGALSAGAALKIIGMTMDRLSNTGYAGDAGLLFRAGIFSAGVNMQNLGSGGSGYSLPMNLKAGIALRAIDAPQHGLLLAVDTQYLFKDQDYMSAGLEYTYDNALSVRVGYKLGLGQTDLNGLKGFCGGIGVRLSNFIFDYAIVPYGDLGITHRAMLTYVFANAGRAAAPEKVRKEITTAPATAAGVTAGKVQETAIIKKPAVAAKKAVKPAAAKKSKKAKTGAAAPAAKKTDLVAEAVQLEKDGKPNQAIDKYNAAIAADPGNGSAWNHLGHLYLNAGDKKDAVRCYEEYLKLNPADEKTALWLEKYKQ
jgi:hypothetical protein